MSLSLLFYIRMRQKLHKIDANKLMQTISALSGAKGPASVPTDHQPIKKLHLLSLLLRSSSVSMFVNIWQNIDWPKWPSCKFVLCWFRQLMWSEKLKTKIISEPDLVRIWNINTWIFLSLKITDFKGWMEEEKMILNQDFSTYSESGESILGKLFSSLRFFIICFYTSLPDCRMCIKK